MIKIDRTIKPEASLLLLLPVAVLAGSFLSAPPENVRSVVIAILIFPALEEIVFRGYIQKSIFEHFSKMLFFEVSYANLVATLFFVTLHYVRLGNVVALQVLVPSLLLGWLYDKRQSVRLCFFIHGCWNLAFLFGGNIKDIKDIFLP